jgi:hypothetical protein
MYLNSKIIKDINFAKHRYFGAKAIYGIVFIGIDVYFTKRIEVSFDA